MKQFNLFLILSLGLLILSGCADNNIGIVESSSFENATVNVNGTILTTNDYFISCAAGTFEGCKTIRKFGRNPSVSNNIVPVSISGEYRTPLSPVTLEAISTDSDDNLAGIGARKLIIFGLNSSWDEINETIEMAGTTASTATTKSFIRVYRGYVLESGSYANTLTASHQGDITLRESGGGDIWFTIDQADTGFGVGQTQTGVMTIPADYTGYLLSKCISVETNQPMNVYFFQRTNADDVTVPYSAMRLVEEEDGVENQFCIDFSSPIQKFPEKTDIGFMAKKNGAGTASISVDFEVLLIKNE